MFLRGEYLVFIAENFIYGFLLYNLNSYYIVILTLFLFWMMLWNWVVQYCVGWKTSTTYFSLSSFLKHCPLKLWETKRHCIMQGNLSNFFSQNSSLLLHALPEFLLLLSESASTNQMILLTWLRAYSSRLFLGFLHLAFMQKTKLASHLFYY